MAACAAPIPRLTATPCADPKLVWPVYESEARENLSSSEFVVLTVKERRAFLWSFNHRKPLTGWAPETVGYFELAHFDMVWLIFVHQGCVWLWRPMGRTELMRMIAMGRGT